MDRFDATLAGLVPLVFLLASILMLGNSVIEAPRATLLNFGIILIGIFLAILMFGELYAWKKGDLRWQ